MNILDCNYLQTENYKYKLSVHQKSDGTIAFEGIAKEGNSYTHRIYLTIDNKEKPSGTYRMTYQNNQEKRQPMDDLSGDITLRKPTSDRNYYTLFPSGYCSSMQWLLFKSS